MRIFFQTPIFKFANFWNRANILENFYLIHDFWRFSEAKDYCVHVFNYRFKEFLIYMCRVKIFMLILMRREKKNSIQFQCVEINSSWCFARYLFCSFSPSNSRLCKQNCCQVRCCLRISDSPIDEAFQEPWNHTLICPRRFFTMAHITRLAALNWQINTAYNQAAWIYRH